MAAAGCELYKEEFGVAVLRCEEEDEVEGGEERDVGWERE